MCMPKPTQVRRVTVIFTDQTLPEELSEMEIRWCDGAEGKHFFAEVVPRGGGKVATSIVYRL